MDLSPKGLSDLRGQLERLPFELPGQPDPAGFTLPRLMKAPYPVRFRDSGLGPTIETVVKRALASFGEELEPLLARDDINAFVLEELFQQALPDMMPLLGVDRVSRAAVLVTVLAMCEQAPLFEVTPALLSLMQATDLRDSIKAEHLRLPAGRSLYIRMPTADPAFQLWDGRKSYSLDGVLIRESVREDTITHRPYRIWDVLVASQLRDDSDDCMDDAYYLRQLAFPVEEEDQSIAQLMTRYERESYERGFLPKPTPGSSQEALDSRMREAVLLACKILLYINMPGMRQQVHGERSALEKRSPRSAAKQAKLERRLRGTYDWIEVGPLADEVAHHDGNGGSDRPAVKMHFRRGHLRNQAYGKGYQDHRITWIKPTIVGTGHEREPVAAKSYRVHE